MVLKGRAPSTLRFIDRGSAFFDGRRFVFGGGGEACGTLDGDVVERYAALALGRATSGELFANRLYGAAFGDDATAPPDPRSRGSGSRSRPPAPSAQRGALSHERDHLTYDGPR